VGPLRRRSATFLLGVYQDAGLLSPASSASSPWTSWDGGSAVATTRSAVRANSNLTGVPCPTPATKICRDRARPSAGTRTSTGAFNHAWQTYGSTDPAHVEEIAHHVWAAVKKRYQKIGNIWVAREDA
jgi:hypothetical protein